MEESCVVQHMSSSFIHRRRKVYNIAGAKV